jgi:hypothetical protein
MNVSERWQSVTIECELRHLPLMRRWIGLWEEAARPLPERLTIMRGERGFGPPHTLFLEARRQGGGAIITTSRHLIDSLEMESANFDVFASVAETVMHALDSRAGEASPPSSPAG